MFIQLDEVNGRLAEVSKQLTRLIAFNSFYGPMQRRFKRKQVYQYVTVTANSSGQVYIIKNPQPETLIGVITEVGNNWFEDTYLEWMIDYSPRKIEYVIGDVDNPHVYNRGIPFVNEVSWTAYNNSGVSHVFEVLCDGFFIENTKYDAVVGSIPY